MNLTVVGIGNMGSALARRLRAAGYRITMTGSRSVEKLSHAASTLDVEVETIPALAVEDADAVICAMWPEAFFRMAENLSPRKGALLMTCMSDLVPDFSGKTVGIATERKTSVAEQLAATFPDNPVVEAFNLTFSGLIQQKAEHQKGVLTLPYCGDDPAAKALVAEWIRACDYLPMDVGALNMSRSLETLATAWVQFAAAGALFPEKGISIL